MQAAAILASPQGWADSGLGLINAAAILGGDRPRLNPPSICRILLNFTWPLDVSMPQALRPRFLHPAAQPLANSNTLSPRRWEPDEVMAERTRFLVLWSVNQVLSDVLRWASAPDLAAACRVTNDPDEAAALVECAGRYLEVNASEFPWHRTSDAVSSALDQYRRNINFQHAARHAAAAVSQAATAGERVWHRFDFDGPVDRKNMSWMNPQPVGPWFVGPTSADLVRLWESAAAALIAAARIGRPAAAPSGAPQASEGSRNHG